jgi:MFS family permease
MNKFLLKCTFAAALGGLLFGYDTVIINGAMTDLVKYFYLSLSLQGWTVSSTLVGCILGLFSQLTNYMGKSNIEFEQVKMVFL